MSSAANTSDTSNPSNTRSSRSNSPSPSSLPSTTSTSSSDLRASVLPPWSTSETAYEWNRDLLGAIFTMEKCEKEGADCLLPLRQARALRLYFEALDKYGATKGSKGVLEDIRERSVAEKASATDRQDKE